MSVQDRNVHRDAQALRKSLSVPLAVPLAGVDQDEPLFIFAPKYNWRLSELYGSVGSIATADLIAKAQCVPLGTNALGSPQLAQGTAVTTFLIEEFWRRGHAGASNGFVNVAAVAAQAFGALGVATVLDGFWGVWLIQVDQSSLIVPIAQADIMAFATEAEALAHCPSVRDIGALFKGRLAILTVQAVGGDFIAGTTNTDAALVAAFNTAPQDGHVITFSISNTPQAESAVLQSNLRDASRTKLLGGKGSTGVVNNVNGATGDLLVVSVRSDGASVVVGGQVNVELRPSPVAGEGRGDTSVSQTSPLAVP
jgi:hypothetical protein